MTFSLGPPPLAPPRTLLPILMVSSTCDILPDWDLCLLLCAGSDADGLLVGGIREVVVVLLWWL
jgi:hypothetical protein